MKEPELTKIDINKIKIDNSNPNKMSEKQFASLKKSIKKFGNIVPLILDKNLKIADGEHRLLAYKELGLKIVPAYVLDIDDPDRRILRQVMNKLKGKHNIENDIEDFKRMMKDGIDISQMSELLAEDEKYFKDMLKLDEVEVEQYLILRESDKDNLPKNEYPKQIKLVLTEEQKAKLKTKFEGKKIYEIIDYFLITE